jgi:double-stranded uracil-DNA glycosylase
MTLGFSREELEAFRDVTVPDLIGELPPRLVFVGINPGLWTAATQTHFAHPGNRFYPALYRAGITPRELDRAAGLSDADRRALTERGIAITNVVARATAKASELTTAELRQGGVDLVRRVERWAPRVVAIAGITAYRTAFGRRTARPGLQDVTLGGAQLWIVPNPSGLNAHETVDSLAASYREVALAAGIDCLEPPASTGRTGLPPGVPSPGRA